ncbi:dynein axonemal assembly factor 6-like [Liolophura sinensis]|uniref:dynein axonemal assembly factor 6-like n=1 Tax=Liolophura sinensis TaxID=3198878 RepID=UPI0031591553
MELGGLQAAALAHLLKPKDEESDSDEDQPSSSVNKFNPGNIGPTKTVSTKINETSTKKPNSKNIWEAEEVPEGSEFDDIYDPRPQPEYEIVYKQAVTSEDMFLGMSNKTPTTASCEDMVVKIHLPGAKIADVQLDVKTKFLDCRSSKFKLGLHLPHPVDSKSSKAQWDGKKEELCVTLRLMREYDMLNF